MDTVDTQPQTQQQQPGKVLPTDRVSLENHLKLLRAFAISSDMGKKLAERQAVADMTGMNVSTVTLANPFLVDMGFLTKNGKKFEVAPEVISFARAFEWNPETASQKLAPKVKKTWFAEALLPRVRFKPLGTEDAISILAEVSASPPQYRNRLEAILEFMDMTGVISKENGQISIAKGEQVEEEEDAEMPKSESSRPKNVVVTSPSMSAPLTDGTVQFHISVKVDMNELKDWKPDRIAAFFGGIAQVLAAKSEVEDKDN